MLSGQTDRGTDGWTPGRYLLRFSLDAAGVKKVWLTLLAHPVYFFVCLFGCCTLQMLKNTVIDKQKKMSQKAVVTEDTEKLANAMYVSFLSYSHDTLL